MSARTFLGGYTLHHFEKPDELIAVSVNDSLLDVIRTLSEGNIMCAPVKSDQGYVGVADLSRLVNNYFLDSLEHAADKSNEDLTGLAQLTALKSLDKQLLANSGLGVTDDVQIFNEKDSLLEACKTLGTMNQHRILVGDDQGILVNFVTQSAVVRLLANKLEAFQQTAARTLEQCHLTTPSDLVTIPRSVRTIDAFKMLRDKEVSAAPVVAENGAIIGNLSVRDIRGALTGKRVFAALHKSVTEYIACNAPDRERSEMLPAITCSSQTTLGEVISKLAVSRIHRVYVVDASGLPIRTITLSDVLAALITPNAD
ncbi:uncharacterized protein MONBRDRAFT_31131 [Monosiga brevicollis MX1]|uniref:CBS domain-containing protein n=1 Tax=Monosiga brevicollis TaxID=81824 RepID=A9URX9_MONBE|nr:uncharacterized protein MONBRDRAFT_31131 [Monosiga brevicollis MX1]EDQ91682.1 predicted protein [Monosiga brevicollis MX1]|eukprot:XP_001742968.1 hypothetical protein [Monosiga brevicollis MX1]